MANSRLNSDWNYIIESGKKVGLNASITLILAKYVGIIPPNEVSVHSAGLAALMDKGFISYSRENDEYSPTKEGIRVFRKVRRDTDHLATVIRQMYPPGMKDGKWPWRGTPKEISSRLTTFLEGFPDITDEEIVNAVRTYLANFPDDNGRSLLGYFIYKTLNGETRSLLAEYVYAEREGKEVKKKSNYDQI